MVNTDFFSQQQRARDRSFLLLIYFVLAVVAIVAALNIVAVVAWYLAHSTRVHPAPPPWTLYYWTTGIVLTPIVLGSAAKIWQLAGGGARVAEMIGAQKLASQNANSQSAQGSAQRLQNIVEEMAIASGIPAPPIYILESDGINAFVAGYQPAQAIICVTRGCMEKLSRDELQGVVAHEFSHIFNGDMRLNIRMLSVLHGIVMLGAIGRGMMDWSTRAIHRRKISKEEASPGAIVFMLGLAMAAAGFIGVLAARMIKAAIARQREFLADASAVQYTRNPHGIGGALYKIMTDQNGSAWRSRWTEEVSHMFLADAGADTDLFATHPPLRQRIAAIGPGLLSELEKRAKILAEAANAEERARTPNFDGDEEKPKAPLAQIAHPQSATGQAIRSAIATEILNSSRSADTAEVLLYALLLAPQPGRTAPSHIDSKILQQLLPQMQNLDPRFRLTVLDLCVPTLRAQNAEQRRTLVQKLRTWAWSDGKLHWVELLVIHLLGQRLVGAENKSLSMLPQRLTQYKSEATLVLSALAHAGSSNQAEGAFQRAMSLLKWQQSLASEARCQPQNLEYCLQRLQKLAAQEKLMFLQACQAVILADEKVNPQEYELMRLVAALLDCPMSPQWQIQDAA